MKLIPGVDSVWCNVGIVPGSIWIKDISDQNLTCTFGDTAKFDLNVICDQDTKKAS